MPTHGNTPKPTAAPETEPVRRGDLASGAKLKAFRGRCGPWGQRDAQLADPMEHWAGYNRPNVTAVHLGASENEVRVLSLVVRRPGARRLRVPAAAPRTRFPLLFRSSALPLFRSSALPLFRSSPLPHPQPHPQRRSACQAADTGDHEGFTVARHGQVFGIMKSRFSVRTGRSGSGPDRPACHTQALTASQPASHDELLPHAATTSCSPRGHDELLSTRPRRAAL